MKNSLRWHQVKDKKIYILIFAIPALLMFFAYAIKGVHPFGDESVLVLDLNGQYVYYYEYLRDAFWGEKSIIYSWSRNLSGEMFGIVGYYLASPFMIIPILLPRSMMLFSIELMQIFKIGTAAVAFAFYIKNRRAAKINTTIIFSILYSLMSYCIVQLMNPMWVDGLVYLPFIVYGIEKLVDEGKMSSFIIPLGLMFIANFYIGYMIGIFCAIYFIYYVFGKESFDGAKKFLISCLKFAISAIVSVMLSMIVLLPVYNSLSLGKFEFTDPDFSLKTQFTFMQFLTKLLPYSYDTVRPEGLPIVFCGTLTLILVPLYFLNQNIKAKQKVSSGILLGVMYLCMYLSTVDIAFHGFQVPNWLPYRYSFIFCFIMLVLAAQSLDKLTGISFKQIGGTVAVIAGFLIYFEHQDFKYLDPLKAILSCMILVIIYGVLLFIIKKYKRSYWWIAVVLLVCGEIYTVNFYELKAIDQDVVYSTYSSYQNYIKDGRSVVEKIEKQDDGLYRSEKVFHRTVNDPMAFGLKGISHSSSTMNSPIIDTLGKLGFTSRGHYTKYNGATPVTDSLLGVKYVLSKDKPVQNYQEFFKQKNIGVYKNSNALSIGYMANKSIYDVYFEKDPFMNQNLLISNMVGDTTKQPFKRIYSDYVDYENITVEFVGEHTKYTPEVKGQNAHIEYKLTAPTDDMIYLFFPTEYEREFNLWVNKEFISVYYETENYCIMPVGKFNKGQEISVMVSPLKDEIYMQDQYFYYLDQEIFDNAISNLKQGELNIIKHSDTFIKGEIAAKEDGVMFTSIPYEKGWTVEVDGKEADIEKLSTGFIGVELKKGIHEITMRFLPDYFIVGIIISIIGLILIVVIIILEKRSSKILLNQLHSVKSKKE